MAIRLTSTRHAAALHGVKILVYGQAGSGKTVLASTTGGTPLIISAEAGLLSLRHTDIPVLAVSSIDDIHEAYEFVVGADEARQYDWICIDSISEVAEVVLATEKKQNRDPRAAYGALQEQMMDLIRVFRDLPRNVYMSAKLERLKDDLAGTMLYAPAMPGAKLGQQIPYLFDEVFAIRAEKDAEGVVQRWLQTSGDEQYVAKDRSGVLDKFEAPSISAVAQKILNTQI